MKRVDPLEFIKEQLGPKSETRVQLDAANRLGTIMGALGSSRCSELIPFLKSYCFPIGITQAFVSAEVYSNTRSLNAKEEVMAAIAKQLGTQAMLYIPPHEFQPVLSLLEQMCQVEETVVRDAACDSIGAIVDAMADRNADRRWMEQNRDYIQTIYDSAAKGSSFPSRVSAARISPYVWTLWTNDRLGDTADKRREQANCRQVHTKLCKDDMPMVSVEAFKSLPIFINRMNTPKEIRDFVIPLGKIASTSIQEATRRAYVDAVAAMVPKVAGQAPEPMILQVEQCAKDASWRVRRGFVAKLPEIINEFSTQDAKDRLLPLFVQLCQDQVIEVKIAALNVLPDVVQKCQPFQPTVQSPPAEVERTLLPVLVKLMDDNPDDLVKEALANNFVHLGTVVREGCIGESIIPMMEKFLTDESCVVKYNACNNLQGIVRLMDKETFNERLGKLIEDIAKDVKYRSRLAVIENLHHIAGFLGEKDFANSSFEKLLVEAYTDPTCAVRRAAVSATKGIVEILSGGWEYVISSKCWETITRPYEPDTTANYHHRLVAIYFLQEMAELVTDEIIQSSDIETSFKSILCKALGDEVVNVRIETMKVAAKMVSVFGENTEVQAKLQEVLKDSEDHDVQYFAKVCLDLYQASY